MKKATSKPTAQTPKKTRAARRALKWRPIFLEEIARSGNVKFACLKAGIHRSTAYEHKDRDSAFAEQWDDAVDEAVDLMEAVARSRAVNGTDKPVFQGGRQVGTIREYSDTLLIFLLKAHRPEKFRDNYDLGKIVDALKKQ